MSLHRYKSWYNLTRFRHSLWQWKVYNTVTQFDHEGKINLSLILSFHFVGGYGCPFQLSRVLTRGETKMP